MKDEFQPLEPVGHETTEARIVAWVHGEVSATEAAELEKLCAIRPDLERFRRQIADLHGLLGEATTDSGWALSAERRARLEAAFVGAPAGVSPRAAKTTGRWVRPVLFAAAACVALAAGFHFIVGPVGDNRPVAKDRSLPAIAAATRTSKAPADFRADTLVDDATSSPQEFSAPAAPAAMPPIAATEDKLADGLAATWRAAQPFPSQELKAEPIDKAIPESAIASRSTAGVSAEIRAMASPVLRKDLADAKVEASEPEVRSDEGELLRALTKLHDHPDGWQIEFHTGAYVPSRWRVYRLQNDQHVDAFEVSVSTAKDAKTYRLARGGSVKLIVQDEKGVECSRKLVAAGGKTMTVEAFLREALAGK